MIRAAVLAVAAVASPSSLAATINICVNVNTEFSDNSDNRDPLTDGTQDDFLEDGFNSARGALISVTWVGIPIFVGHLGDGLSGTSGCTGQVVNIPAYPITIYVKVSADGDVNGHTFEVQNDANGNVHDWTVSRTLSSQPANNTLTINYSPTGSDTRAFAAYVASALALYRHNGGLTGGNFRVRVDALKNRTWGPGYGFDATVFLTERGAQRKYVVAHEMGHGILAYRIGDGKAFGNCDLVSEDCPTNDPDDIHSLTGREYQSCAFSEAFAHFYAVDAFNSHSSNEANFHYYKNEQGLGSPDIDVEHGSADNSTNGDYPDRFMEENCGTNWAGRGVELDWLRLLWDMHTPTTACAPVTFPAITDWLDDAPDWWDWNTYYDLNNQANAEGGNLDDCWDAFKGGNGVDHP
jgi:hypothetical protein